MKEEKCYCVCHSPIISRAICPHCEEIQAMAVRNHMFKLVDKVEKELFEAGKLGCISPGTASGIIKILNDSFRKNET